MYDPECSSLKLNNLFFSFVINLFIKFIKPWYWISPRNNRYGFEEIKNERIFMNSVILKFSRHFTNLKYKTTLDNREENSIIFFVNESASGQNK